MFCFVCLGVRFLFLAPRPNSLVLNWVCWLLDLSSRNVTPNNCSTLWCVLPTIQYPDTHYYRRTAVGAPRGFASVARCWRPDVMALNHYKRRKYALTANSMGFAVRVRSAGQKYGPTCHQRNRPDVTEFVTLVRLSSLGQHVGVLALAGYKRRKSALTAGPITLQPYYSKPTNN